jgi:uncharacterized protein YndB with AHSA1/START domain
VIDPATPAVAALRAATITAVRLLDSSPDRVHQAWSDPDQMVGWFPRAIQGSLLVGARTTLVWSDRQVDIDVLHSESPGRFELRWLWSPDGSASSIVRVAIQARGYGSRVVLTDGPFDLFAPGALAAYTDAAVRWGDALANLRAVVDQGTDLRRSLR